MDSGKEKGYSENTVLAVDYFGTLIGAVSFPLILMPNFGVIISCLLIALLNLISALFIELSAGQKSLKRIAIFAALFCALLLALVYSEKIQDWVVNNLYLA